MEKIKNALFQIVNTGMLLLFSLSCIYPFYYIIINSMSNPVEIANGVYFFPKDITWAAYQQLSHIPNLYHSVFVSVARTIVGTVLTVLSCAFVGYLVTKKLMPCRKWIYRFIIFTMFFNSGLIPWYMVMKELHLKNNFLLYVLPMMISAFFIILIKTYIEGMPKGLEEAAVMDGANEFVLFFRVIFPVCLPVLAAVTLFESVNQWNAFIDTQIYNTMSPNLFSLQYVLYNTLNSTTSNLELLKSQVSNHQNIATPQSLKMAITVITVLPIACVYPFLQRFFMKGLLIGSIKG